MLERVNTARPVICCTRVIICRLYGSAKSRGHGLDGRVHARVQVSAFGVCRAAGSPQPHVQARAAAGAQGTLLPGGKTGCGV